MCPARHANAFLRQVHSGDMIGRHPDIPCTSTQMQACLVTFAADCLIYTCIELNANMTAKARIRLQSWPGSNERDDISASTRISKTCISRTELSADIPIHCKFMHLLPSKCEWLQEDTDDSAGCSAREQKLRLIVKSEPSTPRSEVPNDSLNRGRTAECNIQLPLCNKVRCFPPKSSCIMEKHVYICNQASQSSHGQDVYRKH